MLNCRGGVPPPVVSFDPSAYERADHAAINRYLNAFQLTRPRMGGHYFVGAHSVRLCDEHKRSYFSCSRTFGLIISAPAQGKIKPLSAENGFYINPDISARTATLYN